MSTQYKEQMNTIEEAEILFDDDIGEASLTKNFYFAIDVSGSMDGGCSGKRKMDGAKNAILKFLDVVPNDVNLGLLLFGTDTEITEVVSLGPNNREEFKSEINKLNPNGSTPLGMATRTGTSKLVEQYKKQLGYGEYRLIIVTDGNADSSSNFRRALENCYKYPFIAIYGIGLCMDSGNVLRTYALSYIDAKDYKQLEKALTSTIAELPVFDPTDFTEE